MEEVGCKCRRISTLNQMLFFHFQSCDEFASRRSTALKKAYSFKNVCLGSFFFFFFPLPSLLHLRLPFKEEQMHTIWVWVAPTCSELSSEKSKP